MRNNVFTRTLFPYLPDHLLEMDRSTKRETLTPQQVARRAREGQLQGHAAQEGRNGPERQSSSVPRVSSRGSPALSSSSLSPSILDYTRRTQVEELESQAKAATRNDAVMDEMNEDDSDLPSYPGTAARRNITVRRSRDRLSGKPQIQPRTPEDLLRRRSMDRPRDLEYEEQVSRETSEVTYKRKHG